MIYVDDFKSRIDNAGKHPISFSGHLFAYPLDDSALLAFGHKIGLRPEWLQKPGTPRCHFDVTRTMRAEAVRRGAKEVSYLDGSRLRHEIGNHDPEASI
jgi:hypothetical protein